MAEGGPLHCKSSVESCGEPSSTKFDCCICGMSEKCKYGFVEWNTRMHSWKYNEEVYYILDPFRNRNKVDERRLSSKIGEVNIKSGRNDSKLLNILDYFVLGAICAICGQSVCFDELCSVFYYKTFCATCVMREQMHFPKEIIEEFMARKNSTKSMQNKSQQPEKI